MAYRSAQLGQEVVSQHGGLGGSVRPVRKACGGYEAAARGIVEHGVRRVDLCKAGFKRVSSRSVRSLPALEFKPFVAHRSLERMPAPRAPQQARDHLAHAEESEHPAEKLDGLSADGEAQPPQPCQVELRVEVALEVPARGYRVQRAGVDLVKVRVRVRDRDRVRVGVRVGVRVRVLDEPAVRVRLGLGLGLGLGLELGLGLG